MKKFYTVFLIMIIPFCFIGCEDDDTVDTPPSIVFSTTRTSVEAINLDEGTGPNIRGWAVAPAGLAQVTITADKTSGGEELLNVSSFNVDNSERNGTAFEFNVHPEYTADFTGITVTAMDLKNRSEQVMLEVSATGGSAGPALNGFPEEPVLANIRPSVNVKPEIQGSASSHWGLEKITIIEVYGEVEEEKEVISDFGDSPNQLQLDLTPDYEQGYSSGLTGLKIVAIDKRGNTSELVIALNITDASAAPIITFEDESVEADLTVDPQVTPVINGSIESFEGLVSVTFYVVRSSGDEQLGDPVVTFDDTHNYSFSFDDFPYGLGVSGLKVVAVDQADQTVTETLPITVTADDPDLIEYNDVVLHAQADREDAGVNTCFSVDTGMGYNLVDVYDDPSKQSLIDIITVDSGGNDEMDLFSPDHTGWLENNYFKTYEWATRSVTRMKQITGDDVQTIFNNATSMDIRSISLDGGDDRIDPLFQGDLVYFETSAGAQVLMYFKDHNPNAEVGTKADIFTFDFKVVK